MSNVALRSLPGRLLCRLGPQLRVAHPRRRASLATVQEDLPPPKHSPELAPQPPSVKTYEELPAATGYPVLGTLVEFLAAGGVQHQHEYVTRRHRELGGVFRENLAGMDLVFVSDPVAIREVFNAEGQHPQHFIPQAWLLYNQERGVRRGLFFMEGEEWKKHRSVLNRRLLRPTTMLPHLPALGRVADSLVDRWTSLFPGQPVQDLEGELYRWSIESLGVMVFGSRLGLLGETPSSAVEQQRHAEMGRFIEAIHGIFKETTALGTFPPTLARSLRLPAWKRFTGCLDNALASGQALVRAGLRASREGRKDEDQHPPTLLDHLLHDDRLQEPDILCLLTDLFLAAADTTSHTTIWSLYLLGRHPEVVQRARQEVMEVTGGTGRVEGQHLAHLCYLKGVVKEALRMYPVAPFQTRVLQRSANLGGHRVPAGTMVILSVYTTGRDPAIFPNPDCFSPDRWLRDAPATAPAPSSTPPCPLSRAPNTPSRLHSHAFIPFGVGARSCIGRRVAETQLHLLLAKLVARADLRALNQVDMVMRMVGVTSQPLQLQVEPHTPTVPTTHP